MKVTIQSVSNSQVTNSDIVELKEGSKIILSFPNHYNVKQMETITNWFKSLLHGEKDVIIKPSDVTYEILTIEN